MSSHRVDWILTTRRQAAEEAARQVEEKLLQKDASYREASRELKQTGAKLALARVGGADTKELEMRMRKWEKIKAERLRKNGLTEADLLPRYTCPVCRNESVRLFSQRSLSAKNLVDFLCRHFICQTVRAQ